MKALLLTLSFLLAGVGLAEMNPGGIGSPASFPEGFTGVTDGSAPAAGEIGEMIADENTSVAAAASNVQKEICSLTMTPGTWMVSGAWTSNHGSGGGTGVTLLFAGYANAPNIGPNGILGTGEIRSRNSMAIGGGTATLDDIDNLGFSYPNDVVTVSTNTTFYLNARIAYSGGAPTWDCRLTAVRIR